MNPPKDKIDWIEQGFDHNEFYFVTNNKTQMIGMFRLMFEDALYWGKQELAAGYMHSLIIKKEFSGSKFGERVIKKIELKLWKKNIFILRLDCNTENLGLCRYYENLGFEKVGEIQMPHSLNNLYEKIIPQQTSLPN